MSDELRDKLRAQSESWTVPPHDYRSVARRGRRLMWRRRLASSGLAIVVGLGVLVATQADLDLGPEPAATRDEQAAAAATVAYHALEAAGQRLDYDGIELEDGERIATFVKPTRAHPLAPGLRALREITGRLQSERAEIIEELKEARIDRSRSPSGIERYRLRRLVSALERRAGSIGQKVKENEDRLETFRDESSQREQPTSLQIHVALEGDSYVVTGIEGDGLLDDHSAVRSYEEPADEVETGFEFHSLGTSAEVGSVYGGGGTITLIYEAQLWWAGPVPSDASYVCRVVLLSADGDDVIARGPASISFDAPGYEAGRDDQSVSGRVEPPRGVDLRDDVPLDIECEESAG